MSGNLAPPVREIARWSLRAVCRASEIEVELERVAGK
jgi:hypothetical protein